MVLASVSDETLGSQLEVLDSVFSRVSAAAPEPHSPTRTNDSSGVFPPALSNQLRKSGQELQNRLDGSCVATVAVEHDDAWVPRVWQFSILVVVEVEVMGDNNFAPAPAIGKVIGIRAPEKSGLLRGLDTLVPESQYVAYPYADGFVQVEFWPLRRARAFSRSLSPHFREYEGTSGWAQAMFAGHLWYNQWLIQQGAERMAKKHDVHVTKTPGGSRWRVSQGGETISTHNTQSTAVDVGRREAKRDSVDLVTHGRDGRIRSKDSFGRDPMPPRDREH